VSAPPAPIPLLGYRELYERWERQQWSVADLDFTQDRADWRERFDSDRRRAERYGLSGFFLGEQRVAQELGPMMRAAPSEEARLFLATQIADEARHVAFFDRFYAEVGVMRADSLDERIDVLEQRRGTGFTRWFDEALASRVDRLAADPNDTEAMVEAVTIYHLLIEGTVAVSTQHFILDRLETEGVLPAFTTGFNNVARDEHRHVAFGMRFLRDAVRDGHTPAVQRALDELVPSLEQMVLPPTEQPLPDDFELMGSTAGERRALAHRELERRLSVIGL
jgi:ribonucleoside-diphosphate reductase beta chain